MVEGQPCAICHTRRPRRYCPGVRGHICPVCCGTERENTVSCPLDCPYLREARVREKERIPEAGGLPKFGYQDRRGLPPTERSASNLCSERPGKRRPRVREMLSTTTSKKHWRVLSPRTKPAKADWYSNRGRIMRSRPEFRPASRNGYARSRKHCSGTMCLCEIPMFSESWSSCNVSKCRRTTGEPGAARLSIFSASSFRRRSLRLNPKRT